MHGIVRIYLFWHNEQKTHLKNIKNRKKFVFLIIKFTHLSTNDYTGSSNKNLFILSKWITISSIYRYLLFIHGSFSIQTHTQKVYAYTLHTNTVQIQMRSPCTSWVFVVNSKNLDLENLVQYKWLIHVKYKSWILCIDFIYLDRLRMYASQNT